jgi:AcrR family transcriptional regulator
MSPRQRGRKPDRALDTAIRDAVLELLPERGFAMTFDDVAARAGVGRATVFRRFATKRDMILEAVAEVSLERIDAPDTGSVHGDLLALITNVMAVFGDPRTRALARYVHGQACSDPAFTDLVRTNLDRRLNLVTAVLQRSLDRGELLADTDIALLADLVSGTIAIRLVADDPLPDEAEIERLVRLLLHGCTKR